MTRGLTIILMVLSFISCEKDRRDIKSYNDFLGQEKADALDQGLALFDQFLNDNYSNQPTQGLQIEAFLKTLSKNPDSYGPDTTWIFNTQKNKEVFQLLETSGMRQEIRLYGYEDYDYGLDSSNYLTVEIEEEEIIPIAGQDSTELAEQELRRQEIMEKQKNRLDSSLWFNIYGKYLQGLKTVQDRDRRIQNYIEAVETSGGTTISIAIDGALKGYDPKDYEDPFIKRILFAEIFWHIIQWDIRRKE